MDGSNFDLWGVSFLRGSQGICLILELELLVVESCAKSGADTVHVTCSAIAALTVGRAGTTVFLAVVCIYTTAATGKASAIR